MRRVLLKALLASVVLVCVVALGAYIYLRRSLPQVDGTVTVSGLSAPVDIIRDADSITHVFGKTKLDAYFGLGYAHAQDRLWQMEFRRRVGHGRRTVLAGAGLARAAFFGRARRLGTDFLPELDERDFVIFVEMPGSISLEDGQRVLTDVRTKLLEFPEVKATLSEEGRPEDGTDD